MPKAVELLVNSYVKLKQRKALQHLLDGWQNTYANLKRRNSPKNILESLAQEIDLIKSALDSLTVGDDSSKAARNSEVKVLGVDVAVSPTNANVGLPLKTSENACFQFGRCYWLEHSSLASTSNKTP